MIKKNKNIKKRALILGGSSDIAKVLIPKLINDNYEITAHYSSNFKNLKNLKKKYNKIKLIKQNFYKISKANLKKFLRNKSIKNNDTVINLIGFIDNKTFEQVEIPKSISGERYKLLKENLEVTISFMEDKPISIELPNNIECVIESTDAAIKNQTASSSYKPAILDCGIKINVPPFIESGEKIILDTRTLEYVKRVS